MQGHNARNARIESEAILASFCIAMSINAKVMQHNAMHGVASYCELTFICDYQEFKARTNGEDSEL